jgi:hypothetical protein
MATQIACHTTTTIDPGHQGLNEENFHNPPTRSSLEEISRLVCLAVWSHYNQKPFNETQFELIFHSFYGPRNVPLRYDK